MSWIVGDVLWGLEHPDAELELCQSGCESSTRSRDALERLGEHPFLPTLKQF